MKLLLTKIFCTCLSFGIHGQSFLNDPLNDRLEKIDNNSLTRILIHFNDNVDYFSLKEELINSHTPVDERAPIVINKLVEKKENSQKEVLRFLNSNPNHFKNTQAFWIVNMISVEASKLGIENLKEFDEISHIELNEDKITLIDFKEEAIDEAFRSQGGIEPGLDVINVRPLWNIGYTGKGSLAYSYDTGVWPTHPAIDDQFLGNYVPLEEAYYGYFSDLPNGNISSHGTHTIGTMMGLKESTFDTIGVAWNSYYIANDLVTSTVEELPPIDEMVLAFEWALNPDGDISTTEDIPDVINNSWRWYDTADTVMCDGFVVNLMNALEAAGIAVVFSGGNHGPNNTTISSPQRVNTSIVNTFSVGSVNANSVDLPISDFSSRGPKQCPATGDSSLLIHPEVVAPGQSVRSAWGTDSYNTISGTSMASPHVSGVVLLLKEAFPMASGEEILTAIYFTATDIGEIGEDNVYGMGLINAYEAFNYLSNIYTPVPPATGVDLSISVFEDIQSFYCTNELSYSSSIVNKGNSTAHNIIITYGTTENSTIGSITIDSLIPNESIEINIPTHSISTTGYIDLLLEASLDETDYDLINNRRIFRTHILNEYSIPFSEQFEANSYEANDWHIINEDIDESWDTLNFASGIQFSNTSLVMPFSMDVTQNSTDGFISPVLNLPNDQDSLTLDFKYAYNHRHNVFSDTLNILISTDCGDSWNSLFYVGGADLETVEGSISDFHPSNESDWNQVKIDISSYSNENVLIQFKGINRRGNNLFLDDIFVYGNSAISGVDIEDFEFSIAPNPFHNSIKINTNYPDQLNYTLININGQEILTQLTGNEIKTNQLSNGVYFLKIDSEIGSKYIKIICLNP